MSDISAFSVPRVATPLCLSCVAFVAVIVGFSGMLINWIKLHHISDSVMWNIADHRVLYTLTTMASLVTWIATYTTLGVTYPSKRLVGAIVCQTLLLLSGVIFFTYSTVVFARSRSSWNSVYVMCHARELLEQANYCTEISTGFTLLLVQAVTNMILNIIMAVWTVALGIRNRNAHDYEKSFEEVTIIRSQA